MMGSNVLPVIKLVIVVSTAHLSVLFVIMVTINPIKLTNVLPALKNNISILLRINVCVQ